MSLEKIIEKREKKQKIDLLKIKRQESINEANKVRKEKVYFKKNLKILFANFIKTTKITFDKYEPYHAIFYYKGEKYSISFEEWLHEGTGVDGYDTSGKMWALHKWCGGWQGEGHRIIDETEVKPNKDYSNKAIDILAEISKEK